MRPSRSRCSCPRAQPAQSVEPLLTMFPIGLRAAVAARADLSRAHRRGRPARTCRRSVEHHVRRGSGPRRQATRRAERTARATPGRDRGPPADPGGYRRTSSHASRFAPRRDSRGDRMRASVSLLAAFWLAHLFRRWRRSDDDPVLLAGDAAAVRRRSDGDGRRCAIRCATRCAATVRRRRGGGTAGAAVRGRSSTSKLHRCGAR